MLEVAGLHAGYGNIPVLRDVSFSVEAGEILLITGENGAGKSTLLRTVGGFLKPDAGTIRFRGTDLAGRKPEAIVCAGLRLVLDGHRVFPDITVRDNLRLGLVPGRGGPGFRQELDEILAVFPVLEQKIKSRARELSGGQQQMLALSQAFMARPDALLCDEPSLGLARALLPPILAFLRNWARRGVAVVIVEQHSDLAAPYADRALVIERGTVRFTCPAAELGDRLAGINSG